MAGVRVVRRIRLQVSDVFHDFVFALAGCLWVSTCKHISISTMMNMNTQSFYLMTAQYNCAILPSNVIGYFRFDKMFQGLLQAHHEFRAWCDAIAIESRFLRQLFALLLGLFNQLERILGRSKSSVIKQTYKVSLAKNQIHCPPLQLPASTLLIHFGSWCNAIDGHEKQAGRLDQPKQRFDIMEYITENLLFCYAKVHIWIVWMRTDVDDAIHIQIHVIELGQLQKNHDVSKFVWVLDWIRLWLRVTAPTIFPCGKCPRWSGQPWAQQNHSTIQVIYMPVFTSLMPTNSLRLGYRSLM